MLSAIASTLDRLTSSRLAVTATATTPPAKDQPAPSREHIPELTAQDVAGFMTGQQSTQTVLITVHYFPETRDENNNPLLRLLNLMPHRRPDPAGKIWLTAGLLHYQFPNQQGLVALRHVLHATAVGDHLDLALPGKTLHFPRLCRTQALEYLINGILDNDYDAQAPIRKACRNCRHFNQDQRCRRNALPSAAPDCCPSTQHLDWCPAHTPVT